MPKNNRKIILTSLLILLSLFSVLVEAYPSPTGFVNDFANIMDQRSIAEIELIAGKLQKEQGIELAVVTVPNTAPLDPKAYITELFNSWGVGGPEDSGLMILLSVEEGAIEVETGYGLEGALPDGKVGAVIDQEGIPHFQNKRFGQGLAGLASAYATILAGEEFELAGEKKESTGWLTAFAIFVLIVFLLRRSRRYPPGGTAGGGGGRTIFMPRVGPSSSRGGIGRSGGFGGGRSGGGGAGRRF